MWGRRGKKVVGSSGSWRTYLYLRPHALNGGREHPSVIASNGPVLKVILDRPRIDPVLIQALRAAHAILSTARLLRAGAQMRDLVGGASGIRTHVTVSRKHAFQACAFNHSATAPHASGGGPPGGRRVI
jgi:hypothetical protein